MPRFFVPPSQIYDEEIVILGDDAKHIISSLRMREGEEITVCDMNRHDYFCRISTAFDGIVRATILGTAPSKTEFPMKIRLFQSVPKGDKFEYIVQKSVEMGVCEIIPVFSSRCVVKPELSIETKKLERYRRIAYEAAKQCGRGIIPSVCAPISYATAIDIACTDGTALICYEEEDEFSLRQALFERGDDRSSPISFFIGPEGGYSEEEIEQAEKFGVKPVTLGNRILRCETASGFALACASFAFEL